MSSVGDLFVMLGFKVDDKQLKGFDNAVKSLRNNMAGMVAETVGAVYAIDKLTSGIAHSLAGAQNLSNFTRQTGLDNYKAQIWGVTGTLDHMGVKAEETQNALFNLNEQLASIRRGESGPSAAMGQIGITGADDAYTAWEKIRQARQTFPQFQGSQGQANFTSFLQSLGVPTGLAPAFKMSFEEQEAKAKPYVKSQKDIDRQNEANDALQETTQEFNQLYSTLTTDLVPEIRLFNKDLHALGEALHFAISPPDKKMWQYPGIVQGRKDFRDQIGADKLPKDRTLQEKVSDAVYNNDVVGWMMDKGEWIDAKLADMGAFEKDSAGAGSDGKTKGKLDLPADLQSNPIITPQPKVGALPIDGDRPVININGKDEIEWDKSFQNIHNKPGLAPQSNNTTTYKIKIDVNGSESPKETASEVARQLEYTISMNQFANSGVV